MKLWDKETKAGFKWSTVHDGFSIHDCNNAIQSNPLEINHAMRTTNFAMEHFPLQPLQQVQVLIRNLQKFETENENFWT